MSNAFERAVERGDDHIFTDITLRNQSAETDANGDPVRDNHGNIKWASATETAVSGEITYRGQPTFSRRSDGIDTDLDAFIWVSDATATFTDGSGDATQRATRVKADGKTYKVIDVYDERNGRRRAFAELED